MREDDRRYADRGPPPSHANRAPPPRYSEADRHQSERDRYREAMRMERDRQPTDYDARLRELEREVRMLREREHYSISQRPRTRGDRYSADD